MHNTGMRAFGFRSMIRVYVVIIEVSKFIRTQLTAVRNQ